VINAIKFSIEEIEASDQYFDHTGSCSDSGTAATPADGVFGSDRVDEIEALCRRHRAAFFFKQWGGKNKKATGRSYRGGTFDEMPALSM
jgi:protein gp37